MPHLFLFTSHPNVELLHNDVVLEVRIPPEVETDPVADFIIIERLDLREMKKRLLRQLDPGLVPTRCPYLQISHITERIFIRLVNVS